MVIGEFWVSCFERPRAATKDRHTTGNLRIDSLKKPLLKGDTPP